MQNQHSYDTNGYVAVEGLKLYYEVYGAEGRPLVMLPGALSGIQTAFGKLIPELAKTRRVIAIDPQGYGHTADIDTPLSYERYAHYVLGLLHELDIKQADFLGYSTGAAVALSIGAEQPQLVHKLIACSATYKTSGLYPEVLAAYDLLSQEALASTPYELEYKQTAPRPEDWPHFIEKVKAFNKESQDWPTEKISRITAPTLLVVGDSDIVQPEHTVEMFRLLGGGKAGDFTGLPASQLAILPGTTHMALTGKTDLLLPIITQFLEDAA
jgi:pimeloyl-ACP methyl ester carboxylesterase